MRQAEADSGLRRDLPTREEQEEIKRLNRENFELRHPNAILKAAWVSLGHTRPRPTGASAFIDEHREPFGVDRASGTFGVSASAYDRHCSGVCSPRPIEDERLLECGREVDQAKYEADGYWRT